MNMDAHARMGRFYKARVLAFPWISLVASPPSLLQLRSPPHPAKNGANDHLPPEHQADVQRAHDGRSQRVAQDHQRSAMQVSPLLVSPPSYPPLAASDASNADFMPTLPFFCAGAITNDRNATMAWSRKSYMKNIVTRYRIRIEGWPLAEVPFRNLSDVSNLPKLELLLRGWKEGTIRFCRINDAQYQHMLTDPTPWIGPPSAEGEGDGDAD